MSEQDSAVNCFEEKNLLENIFSTNKNDSIILNPSMIENNHPLMIPRRWRGYTGGF